MKERIANDQSEREIDLLLLLPLLKCSSCHIVSSCEAAVLIDHTVPACLPRTLPSSHFKITHHCHCFD